MLISAEVGERIVTLIREGKTCNAIARETGVAASTVSRRAKAAGLSFDREQTASAVEAARVDAAVRRAEVGAALLEDIDTARLSRLRGVANSRDFQQVAQGLAALSRAYKDLAVLPGPPDTSVEDTRATLRQFLDLVIVSHAERDRGDEVIALGGVADRHLG